MIQIADIERTRASVDPPDSTSALARLGPSSQVQADEIEVRLVGWRTALSVPARVSDILDAVTELSRPAATA